MKKFILSLMFMMAAWMGANAMSFERAQAEALYLTDKMAYELNLNDQQYNDAYEINLDYFLCVDSPSDLYGVYYNHRLGDLRCILYDWQYSLLMAADYFLRPVVWRAGSWFFPIYSYYNRGYFYYSRPSVWVSYYGGHSHAYHHSGFYAHRRPVWNGGLRGHDMHHRPSPGIGGHAGHVRPGESRPGGGRGYHIDVNGHRGGGMNPGGGHNNHNNGGGSMNPGNGRSNPRSGSMSSGSHRGNSFDGSSSRGGGSYSSPSGGSHRGFGSSSFGGGSRSGGGSRGGSFGGGHSGGHSRGGRR